MLMVSVTDSAGTVVCDNPVAFAHPKNMSLPKASVSFEVGAQEEGGGPVAITLSSDNFALYVTLTTLAQGRFGDNAFVMLPGSKLIKFIPFANFKLAELKQSLRIEHTTTYRNQWNNLV